MDLSKLSNADLIALQNKQYDKISNEGIQHLHSQAQPQLNPTSENTTKPTVNAQPLRNALDGNSGNPVSDKFVKSLQTGGIGVAPMQIAESAVSGLRQMIAPTVERAGLAKMLKQTPEKIEPYVAGKISGAKQAFTDKSITPLMERQQALAEGRTVQIKPQDYMGHSPEADAILQRHVDQVGANKMYEMPGTVDIPVSDALEVRQHLNAASKFNPAKPFTPEVSARNTAARGAGDQLRNQLSSLPEVGEELASTSDSLKDAYSLRTSALGKADKPMATIKPSGAASSKNLRLQTLDKTAGTDLSRLGQNMKIAEQRASQPGLISGIKTAGDVASLPVEAARRGASTVRDMGANALQSFLGTGRAPSEIATLQYLLRNGQQGDSQ